MKNNKYLVYTFRTFPYLFELSRVFDDIFVLGKLKYDINKFYDKIVNNKPEYILGIAKNYNNSSCLDIFPSSHKL